MKKQPLKKGSVSNPVALVTGSGRRLGRKIALELSRNGYDIVVHHNKSGTGARETVKLIRGQGTRAIAVKADISRGQDVATLVAKARKQFGRIDLLVNSAAVFTEGTILDTSERLFDTTLGINLRGMFLCSQAVASLMIKQKRGNIINIVSLGGIQPWSKHLAYSVSKAGAIMLTKCMAKSLAPQITVNAIAPGTIILTGEEDPNLTHIPVKGIPLKKYGSPGDITSLVIYLATKARYITGHIFVVDGGRSLTIST